MLYVLTLKFAPALLVRHHNQNGYLLSLSLSFPFPSVAGRGFAYIAQWWGSETIPATARKCNMLYLFFFHGNIVQLVPVARKAISV
jgi:hypothetical protein